MPYTKCKIQSNFLNKHLTNLLQCNDSQPKKKPTKSGRTEPETPEWTHLNEKFYLVDGRPGFFFFWQRNNSVNFGYNSSFSIFLTAYMVCVCANLIKTNFHLQRVAHQAISQAQLERKNTQKRKVVLEGGQGGGRKENWVKTITRTSCKLTANTITNTQKRGGAEM